MAKFGAFDRVINRKRRSSLKARGYVTQSYSSANHFKNDLTQSFIKIIITIEIKTDENASGALDRD